MVNQRSGCFTPDYGMRQRNQSCGCKGNNRGTAPAFTAAPKVSPAKEGGCGCKNRPASAFRQGADRGCGRSNGWTMSPPEADGAGSAQYPVGMAYTPWQTWQNVYEAEYGLSVGTIFGDLDYPWEVGGCRK